jgi:hypothetical protein
MNELVGWLQAGIDEGHITADEAFKWIARRAEQSAPSRLRPEVVAVDNSKSPRLKKDGTPWGKRGSKQITMLNGDPS